MHRRTNPLGGPDRLPKFRPYGPIAAERSLKELGSFWQKRNPLQRSAVVVLNENWVRSAKISCPFRMACQKHPADMPTGKLGSFCQNCTGCPGRGNLVSPCATGKLASFCQNGKLMFLFCAAELETFQSPPLRSSKRRLASFRRRMARCS